MMVAGGIVAGVFLIVIEIAYKRHRGLKEKELELAKTAADRWRGNIEVGPFSFHWHDPNCTFLAVDQLGSTSLCIHLNEILNHKIINFL